MKVTALFEHWRALKRPEQSWGLAWFLSYEICKRFHESHGIVPQVIEREGMGYSALRWIVFPARSTESQRGSRTYPSAGSPRAATRKTGTPEVQAITAAIW